MTAVAVGGPRVSSGKGSEQSVGTPREFLDAVERRFGTLEFDLAANADNSVCGPHFYGLGSPATDALITWWGGKPLFMWCNPPFIHIEPWAAKCARDRHPEARIAFLIPASVGSNWFAEHVDGKALVLFLRPRLTFVGHSAPYPKDLILAMYGEKPGYECWKWR